MAGAVLTRAHARSALPAALALGVLSWRLAGDTTGLLCVLLLLLVLLAIERQAAQMRGRYRRVARLSHATDVVSAAISTGAVVPTVLEQARALVRADRAELALLALGSAPGRWAAHAATGPVTLGGHPPADHPALALAADGPGRVLGDGAPLDGCRSAVVVPLRDDDVLLGALVVTLDPVRGHGGRRSAFDAHDLRVLQSLAAAASVAVLQRRLVDRVQQEAAVREHQALFDPLTGLPNRSQLVRRTQEALALGPVSVLVLDLDRFQDVNDTLGHDAGDLLLLKVALRLSSHLEGSGAVLARLSGDEFAVLLPGAGEDGLAREVTSLLGALDSPIAVSDTVLHVRATAGAAASSHASSAGRLLQHAEIAMYDAKRRHAGVGVYRGGSTEASRRRLALVGGLRRTIAADGLEVHFQPVLDVASGQPCGAEALVRWTDPEHGPIGPDEFVPLAEQCGLVAALTRTVLDRALALAATWERQGRDLSVSVNVSPRGLADGSLVHDVTELLARHGVAPGQLVLELTEGTVMQDPTASIVVLQRLADLGVRLSIDDFGTGYSSLTYLKRLPVDEVKIDRSFVRELARDGDDAAIVGSTVRLAHDLGLRVVAEGVEDAVAFAALRELGCDLAQGYLMSRPLARVDLEAWLVAWPTHGATLIAPLPAQLVRTVETVDRQPVS